MKIIFLDIDGVINSVSYIKRMKLIWEDLGPGQGWDNPKNQIDPLAVARLNRIIELTKAKIVVSSTWRLFFLRRTQDPVDAMARCLKSYGISGHVIGVTPEGFGLGRRRGHEIQAWLDHYGQDVEKFVILDDDSDMEHLMSYLVKTPYPDGLLEKHIPQVLAILGIDPAKSFRAKARLRFNQTKIK